MNRSTVSNLHQAQAAQQVSRLRGEVIIDTFKIEGTNRYHIARVRKQQTSPLVCELPSMPLDRGIESQSVLVSKEK